MNSKPVNQMNIAELIRALSSKRSNNLLAEVISVDKVNKTLKVKVETANGEYEIPNVNAKSILTKSDNIIIGWPKKGSMVLIAQIEDTDDFVLLITEEIDEVYLAGNKYSLVNGEELKKEIEKTNQVLDLIVSAFNSWTVVPNDGGAALKALISTALSGKTTGKFNNILNDKVKHGA